MRRRSKAHNQHLQESCRRRSKMHNRGEPPSRRAIPMDSHGFPNIYGDFQSLRQSFFSLSQHKNHHLMQRERHHFDLLFRDARARKP